MSLEENRDKVRERREQVVIRDKGIDLTHFLGVEITGCPCLMSER